MKWKTGLVYILCLLVVCGAVSVSQAGAGATQSTIFINVSEGDAALIRDGSGFDVLVDGGLSSMGVTVDAFLHSEGLTDLDVIVASHADADHIGGLINVLNDATIAVGQVVYNGYPGSTFTWNNFVAAVNARGLALTPLQFPQELTWGGMKVYVLNPPAGLGNPDTNDASLVLRVDYGSVRYLFTGDIGASIESTVVARQTPVASDVLKVPHHGSAYSSSPPFLAAVQPHDSVISVGPNSYGHPSPLAIGRLVSAGSIVWQTAQSGNIRVTSDGLTTLVIPQFAFRVYLPLTLR